MLDNEMAILAPLQEGMQALPAEEVANEGARALRKGDSRPSCEISTWRVRCDGLHSGVGSGEGAVLPRGAG